MSEKSCGSEVECLSILQDNIHSITNTEPTTHKREESKGRRRGGQGGRGRERGEHKEGKGEEKEGRIQNLQNSNSFSCFICTMRLFHHVLCIKLATI